MGNFISKYKYYIAFGIFAINYFLKIYALGVTGFWFDECYSVNMGTNSIQDILNSTQTTDPNPPLYLILLHYWMAIFGNSEYGVRLLSVVASCLASSALFLFCIRFLNWQTAIFASIMFFTSNDLYYYSQEARTFSVLILFVIVSNYLYLKLFEQPKIKHSVLLGICNGVIFYLHLIATFNVVAQLLCFPFLFLNVNRNNALDDKGILSFNITLVKKTFLYYLISLVVFVTTIMPWLRRIANIMGNEGKGNWWLGKPNFDDFKYCIYELFNSKEMYQVYIMSFIYMCLALIFVIPLRESGIRGKKIFFLAISGPCLIYLIFLSAGFSPIFLKRYVLFTFIGFILLYSYIFSMVKINAYAKLTLFIILGIFSFQTVKFPRESFFEYEKAMVFLKEAKKEPATFISTNMTDLFAYYYDQKIFALRTDSLKKEALFKENICGFNSFDTEWIEKSNLSRFKHIYYTCSFQVFDPQNYLGKQLEKNFIMTNEITRFKGIVIRHYLNPNYREG